MGRIKKVLIGVFISIVMLSNNVLADTVKDINGKEAFGQSEQVDIEFADGKLLEKNYEVAGVVDDESLFNEGVVSLNSNFMDNDLISSEEFLADDMENSEFVEFDLILKESADLDEFIQCVDEISEEISISLIEEIGLIHVKLPSRMTKEEFLNESSIQPYVELYGEMPDMEMPQAPLNAIDFNTTIGRIIPRTRSVETDLFDTMAWHVDEVTSDGESLQISQGDGIKIAIIDSGIDYNHPILSGKIDTLTSKSFVTGELDVSDKNGHGTAVAGIIAQIAPEATLTSYKVIGESTGDSEWTIEALIQAVDDRNNIINMSLGTYKCIDVDSENMTILAFERAVEYAEAKECIVVASAGNSSLNLDHYFETEHIKHLPGSIAGVITVSATNGNYLASYSNYGTEIDICAPGGDLVYEGEYIDLSKWIYCLYPTTMDNGLSAYGIPQGYSFSYGTSLSAPTVSAALADIWAMDVNMGTQETISYLKNGATDLGAIGNDIQFGAGEINIKASLDLVAN